jgi:hypothetical protein
MGKRRQAKALRRWETTTRQWAIELARNLALDLYDQRPPRVTPYGIGVVPDPGEIVWAETPMRFDLDLPPR